MNSRFSRPGTAFWRAGLSFSNLGPVDAGHYMAWLQTLVAVESESCQTSFPSFCSPPSEVAVLFDLNLNRRPFLGQVTGCFVPVLYFYSETNDWSKDGAKRWARLWSATTSRQFHRKFHFAWKQKVNPRGPTLKLIERVSIAREVGCFSQASRSRPEATAAD